jgi:integrase
MRWAKARESELARKGPQREEVPAPRLEEFGKRWMRDYSRANGNKPSTLAAKETILRLYLVPILGSLRLTEIGPLQIQRLKLRLDGKSLKTKACVLSVLATMMRTAEAWEEIVKAPKIEVPRWDNPEMDFYDFKEWEALIDGARRAGPMVRAAVLLGGDAGLRRGELVALEQADVGRGEVRVLRNEWMGTVGTPKSGKARRVPLTARLALAVDEARHLRGKRLLWQMDGTPVGISTLQSWLEVACKRAGLPPSRNLHKLRHTFCSHLAMRAVPVTTIQKWAGHASLTTTLRYMHLSPHSTDAMIHVLESGADVEQVSQRVNS